jgi:hypothetical protein
MNNAINSELLLQYDINKYHPYLYGLKLVNSWYIFGSLTWKDNYRRYDLYRAQKYREYDFNRLINVFCAYLKLRPRNLAYYRATEFGGGGEAHLHFLIADSSLKCVSAESCCDLLESLWRSDLKPFDSSWPGVGTAVVKPYDESLEERGLKYCLKREFDEYGNARERYDMLSKPLIKLILTNYTVPKEMFNH